MTNLLRVTILRTARTSRLRSVPSPVATKPPPSLDGFAVPRPVARNATQGVAIPSNVTAIAQLAIRTRRSSLRAQRRSVASTSTAFEACKLGWKTKVVVCSFAAVLLGAFAVSVPGQASATPSWTQIYSGSPFFGGPSITTSACEKPVNSIYGPLYAVQVQTLLSTPSATALTGSLAVYRNNSVIATTSSSSWLYGEAQGLGPVDGSASLGDTYLYTLADGALHPLRLIVSASDLALCGGGTPSGFGQPYEVGAQPQLSVSNAPWDGFGVTWLNGVPASKLGNLNNVTIYPWTTAIANSSSYASSADQTTAQANVDSTQWQLDSQALQTMLPAYVRTPFALPMYVTSCNTTVSPVTCSYNWNTVGMNDKIAELQLMKQLGIKVVLRATPPPQSPSPLSNITFGSAAWTRTQVDLLTYLVHTEGLTNVAYDGEISEPNGIETPGTTTPDPTYGYTNYRAAMKSIKNAIAASSVLKGVVQLLGPSVSNPGGTTQNGSYWTGSCFADLAFHLQYQWRLPGRRRLALVHPQWQLHPRSHRRGSYIGDRQRFPARHYPTGGQLVVGRRREQAHLHDRDGHPRSRGGERRDHRQLWRDRHHQLQLWPGHDRLRRPGGRRRSLERLSVLPRRRYSILDHEQLRDGQHSAERSGLIQY